jgi:hypothetical protein
MLEVFISEKKKKKTNSWQLIKLRSDTNQALLLLQINILVCFMFLSYKTRKVPNELFQALPIFFVRLLMLSHT